jgi:hypothetical protein
MTCGVNVYEIIISVLSKVMGSPTECCSYLFSVPRLASGLVLLLAETRLAFLVTTTVMIAKFKIVFFDNGPINARCLPLRIELRLPRKCIVRSRREGKLESSQ